MFRRVLVSFSRCAVLQPQNYSLLGKEEDLRHWSLPAYQELLNYCRSGSIVNIGDGLAS